MRQVFEDGWGFPAFNLRAAIHHHHVPGVLRDNPQVMGNQNERHAKFLNQFADEVKNLCLNRDIQRCGGLIGDEQVRRAGQRHGDGDALALPARELVWVSIQPLSRTADTDPVKQRRGLLARLYF
jgi:hypothetical protein